MSSTPGCPGSPGQHSLFVEPILGPKTVQYPGAAGSVLYLPACLTSLRTSYEAAEPGGRRPKSTPRKARKQAKDMEKEPATDVYHPQNYLVKGGTRAYEQKITNMNRAAIQDLRAANDMLAAELLRMRTTFEEEREALRHANTQLSIDLRMEQERVKHAQEKLEEGGTVNTTRLREITKRLKDEHNQRLTAQAELDKLKLLTETLQTQVGDTASLRSEVARLEATLAAGNATTADLRSRLATSESRLESESSVRAELQARQLTCDSTASSLAERTSQLSVSLADTEAQLRVLQNGTQAMEDELNHTKKLLQQEREAHASLREQAGKLQSQLTELQAKTAVVVAQSMADKTELDRLRHEFSQLKQQADGDAQALSDARDELLKIRSEVGGLKASNEQLKEEVTSLREKANEAGRLKQQLDTCMQHVDNPEAMLAEHETLSVRLQRTESSLRQKEALLAEALSSHAAQLELWRAEATEVAQAASKWKQRATVLQQQLANMEQEHSNAGAELRSLSSKCQNQEGEVSRLKELSTSLESRLATCQSELTSTKAQLKECLAAQAATARHAESAGHTAAQNAAAVDRLTTRLAEETAKTTALRQDLAAVTQQQVRELDAKSRMLGDLTAALAKEERAAAASQREANSLRAHLAALERELRTAQNALASITDKQLRTQEAYEAAEIALNAAQHKAHQYRSENKALLNQYSSCTSTGPRPSEMYGSPYVCMAQPHLLPTSPADAQRFSTLQQSPAPQPHASPLQALQDAAEQVNHEPEQPNQLYAVGRWPADGKQTSYHAARPEHNVNLADGFSFGAYTTPRPLPASGAPDLANTSYRAFQDKTLRNRSNSSSGSSTLERLQALINT